MRRTLSAFACMALLAAPAALEAAEAPPRPAPKSWIEQVRFYTLRALKDLGRDINSAVASMRRGMASVKDDTAKGLASITREGRRGLTHASQAVSQTTNRVFRDTHDAFLLAGRQVTPGVAAQPDTRGAVAVARKLESPVLAQHFLRGHDILLAWHLDTGGRPIRASYITDDRLLIETTDNDLYSFEPTTGILQWIYALPGGSQSGYGEDTNNILVIAKDVYYEIDRIMGRPRRRIVLPFPASSPPAVRGTTVIVNSWERRVCALDRETRSREWSFVTDETVVGAVAPAPDYVYFADTGGVLTAYSPTTNSAKWTYKAHDGFRVTPVLYLVDVILPAEDLFVHCVNRFSGLLRWKYPVQGQVTQPVWVENDVVYFSADGDAFYAVLYSQAQPAAAARAGGEPAAKAAPPVGPTQDGKLLWRVPKGGWPIALGRDNIYIQGAGREVWCIDRKTGEKRWGVSAEPFTHFVRNTVNDHFYLCTDRGEIYAFYVRGDHLEKKAPPPPPEKKAPPKVKGVPEEPEPSVEPGETPRPKRPTLPPRPPPKKEAEEGVEKGEQPKDKEEGLPAAEEKEKEKEGAKLGPTKSKAPEGEKTPAELDDEEAKRKGKE
ncbi:MAG: hypothetical protein FJ291_11265 [Planctomycetes bacterium]|nr:hypothetical protein [Planctomycetota bacterium]